MKNQNGDKPKWLKIVRTAALVILFVLLIVAVVALFSKVY